MKNKLLYLWIAILLLFLHTLSCTPDQYVQIVPKVQPVKNDSSSLHVNSYQDLQEDTGYVVMRHWQEIYADEFETLNCIRRIEDDTTYWETGCVDNRITPQLGDSKDTIYQTYPWRLIRFVEAKVKLESCGGR